MDVNERIETVKRVKMSLNTGEITYDQAKQIMTPIIEDIYQAHKKIAKKYGQKVHKLSFESLMR